MDLHICSTVLPGPFLDRSGLHLDCLVSLLDGPQRLSDGPGTLLGRPGHL